MNTSGEVEYSNVALKFNRIQVQRLIDQLVSSGFPVAWKETRKFFTLSVRTNGVTQRLTFDKYGEKYKLRSKSYNIKDLEFAGIIQKFIYETKGHAVLKRIMNGSLVIQNIRYGEPVRIVQIEGAQKKILFEKECIITMKQVVDAFKRKDAEERIPVLKLEIDYELACLFEAMMNEDDVQIRKSKAELEKLRMEMLMLEV